MRKILALALILGSTQSWSLEVDEKLTSRFLKVSSSKKTVLLNRGLEDGLVVGDHAKFFLTSGVIARGVVVKASPTRTIWSIYRIIDEGSLFPERVVNIKITRALETTEDPSKSIYDDSNETMEAGTERMALGGAPTGRVRTMNNLSKEDQSELGSFNSLDQEAYDNSGIDTSRTIEAYGLLHLNSLSTTVDEGGDGSFTGGSATVDFSIGLEKYFGNSTGFLQKVSFFGLVHSSSHQYASVQGTQLTSTVFEYGVGANYHFSSPLAFNKLIYYVGGSMGVGSVSDQIEVLTANSTQSSVTVDGTSSFVSLAVGAKYYTRSGFGARMILDYYQRGEDYTIEDSDNYTKTTAGPRLMFGLSYKF